MDRGSATCRATVVMPALNVERTIRGAIASVQRQSFVDWELLVVDNGSSDGTTRIVTDIARADARIVLLDCHAAGAANARNLGIKRARGSVLAFLDADDEWRSGFLEAAVEALSQPGIDLYSAGYSIRSANGTLVQVRTPPERVGRRSFVLGNPFGILVTAINRARNPEFAFPPGRKEDMRAWFRLVKKPDFRCITSPKVSGDYTINSRVEHARRKAVLLGLHYKFYREDMEMGAMGSAAATMVHVLWRALNYFVPSRTR